MDKSGEGSLPTTTDVSKETLQPKESALKKTRQFVKNLYEGNIPKQIKNRLEKLETSIVVDDNIFEKRMIQILQKKNVEIADLVEFSSGFYDNQTDTIYLRKRASENVHVHEMLHFISSDLKSNTSGILETNSFYLSLLNEAITVVTSTLCEHPEEFNIHQPRSIDQLSNRIKIFLDDKSINIHNIYKTAVLNFSDFITGRCEINQVNMTETLPTLIKAYFSNNLDFFLKQIDQQVKPTLLKEKGSSKLFRQMTKIPSKMLEDFRRNYLK